MSDDHARTPDRTREDTLVSRALDKLPELKQFADGPELPTSPGPDHHLDNKYDQDFVPLEEFDDTDWANNVRGIINWAENAGFRVSKDSELHALDLHQSGRIIVNARVNAAPAPLHMYVFCEIDGRVNIQVNVTPLDPMFETDPVYDGPVADLDVDILREEVAQHRPFVTSRAHDLVYHADVNPSQARAVALREVGLSHQQVADHLDITKGASGSYQSKFRDSIRSAEHLVVATGGGPRNVLAKRTFEQTNYLTERWYVCEEIAFPGEETDAPITVSIVRSDRSESDGKNLSISTTGFESLRACIDECYADDQFPEPEMAEERYALFASLPDDRLADAEYGELPDPESRVHPDF